MGQEIGRFRPAQFPISGERGRIRENGGSISRPNVAANVWYVVVVVSYIQRIGCQPEKKYFTRWPIPLVVC